MEEVTQQTARDIGAIRAAVNWIAVLLTAMALVVIVGGVLGWFSVQVQ